MNRRRNPLKGLALAGWFTVGFSFVLAAGWVDDHVHVRAWLRDRRAWKDHNASRGNGSTPR